MRSTPFIFLTSVALCGTLLANPAHAQDRRDPQYRIIKLTDGRTLTAEILSTEPTGLLLRTPQGDSLISFEILLDMAPTDAAAYASQLDWVVYFDVESSLRERVSSMLAAIPGLSPHPVGAVVNGIDAFAAQKASQCAGEGQCIADAVEEASWMWVLTSVSADGATQLRGNLNQGNTRTRVDLPDTSDDQLWLAVHQALGLMPPSGGPPKPEGGRPTPSGKALSSSTVTALSFVPLPGVPSAAQGDWSGAGVAWLIALPASGAFVGASLPAMKEQSPSSFAMLGAGTYLSIVFANQVTGMRSQKQSVSLVPHAGRGRGGLVVTGGF